MAVLTRHKSNIYGLVTDLATLQNNIDAEVSRATGVEGSLTSLTTTDKSNLVSAVNEVVSSLSSSSSTLQANIDAEVTRATGVEASIQAELDATQTALDNKVDVYNISTTEYNTGVKRGTKEVFGIEIDLGLLPNSGTKDVAFTFNPLFTYWIDTSNSYASSSSEVITLPYLGFIGDEVSVKLDRVNNKIVTMAANDRTTLTGKLVILYTK